MKRLRTSWSLCAGAHFMLFLSTLLYATYEKINFPILLTNTTIAFIIAPRGFFMGWVIPKKNYK
jgi:hypothetical protein